MRFPFFSIHRFCSGCLPFLAWRWFYRLNVVSRGLTAAAPSWSRLTSSASGRKLQTAVEHSFMTLHIFISAMPIGPSNEMPFGFIVYGLSDRWRRRTWGAPPYPCAPHADLLFLKHFLNCFEPFLFLGAPCGVPEPFVLQCFWMGAHQQKMCSPAQIAYFIMFYGAFFIVQKALFFSGPQGCTLGTAADPCGPLVL